MSVRMIACDLDGTLLNSEHSIGEYTLKMLKEASALGIILVLSTGRDKGSLSFVYEPLELESGNNYVAGINGEVIYSFEKKEYFVDEVLNDKDAHKCMAIAKKYNMECICCCGYDRYNYISKPLKLMRKVKSLLKGKPKDYGLQDGKRFFIEVNDSEFEITQDVNKVIFIQSATFFNKNLTKIREELKEYDVLKVGPGWIEVMPHGVNKGSALMRIAKENNIDMKDVMCFGDAENDLSMFKVCGYSVAMGNAMKCVKDIAWKICDDHDHEGIGKTIHTYALHQEE
ncbi:MAG: HAD family hydrolase [Erysipelotrichaceae bacterium]